MDAAWHLIVLLLLFSEFGLVSLSCVTGCSCSNDTFGRSLLCTSSSLNKIPDDIPPDIRKVRIEKCHLTELSRGLFGGVNSLEYLWLNFNNITLMHMKSLEDLKSLKELRLQGNKLRSVPWTAFQDTPALRILDLKHNRLDVLPEHALKFLSNLTYLDLSFNQLTIISKEVFSNWPLYEKAHTVQGMEISSNVVLALHDNPWICDCRLKGFVSFVKTVSPPIILMNSYLTCTSPDSRAGKFLHELELNSCTKPTSYSLVSNITVPAGSNVTLVCVITASPTPSISWTYGVKASNIKAYNVSTIVVDEETMKSELVIPVVHPADAGVYNCLAKNYLGNSTSSTIVHVQSSRTGDPSVFPSAFSPSLSSDENAFIDVRIAKQTVYGISLEWFAVTENPSETWYTIYFGKYDDKEKEVINIGPGIYTYSVNDLLPTTKYEVCVTLKSQRPRKGQCIVFMTGSDISELEQREKLIHIIVIVCAMVLAVPAGMYACTTETRLNCIDKCLGICRRRHKGQKNLKKENTKESTFDSLQASSEEGLCPRECTEENRRRRCSEDKLNKAKPENKNPAELY